MTLYDHQKTGIDFLAKRTAAMLCDEMGLGKSRQALYAAKYLFDYKKIACVLVLAPAAVRISWQEEIEKLNSDNKAFSLGRYDQKTQKIYFGPVWTQPGNSLSTVPIIIISYALLPQKRHVEALARYCENALLICDESIFLKNRTAKQTRAAVELAKVAKYRWLLNGTPIGNGPLDLYSQGMVMAGGNGGALRGFRNWYHFRSRYGVLGGYMGKQVVAYQNVAELTKRFAPYVLRREKKDCLDLPEKSYTTREVALSESTWKVYQELKREAMLALPDEAERPEPNAAVRLLRLCQLTSGHIGGKNPSYIEYEPIEKITEVNWIKNDGTENAMEFVTDDVSSEKLDWLVDEIENGELSSVEAIIVWCRWRRERERLQRLLCREIDGLHHIEVYRIFGGQSSSNRSLEIQGFQTCTTHRRVLVAQQAAGGFGLNLTAASTAVYLSNTFSHVVRVQSEDRCHRIGQHNSVIYVDVLATGPKGQRTVDHHVVECLRKKRDVAELTCREWREVLRDE